MNPASSNSFRVLIIDDNEGIHDDFRALLQAERRGDDLDALASELFGDDPDAESPAQTFGGLPTYRFDSAFQGSAALPIVQDAVESGDPCALAFVDVHMPPGWDGVKTIRHLWEIDPNLQMVICSAYSDYSWTDLVRELGPSDRWLLLRKPFDPNAVKQLALAITTRWHRERALQEQLATLEVQLDRARELLAERDAVGAGRSLRSALEASLDELSRTLVGLNATEPTPRQRALITRALEITRSLQDALAEES